MSNFSHYITVSLTGFHVFIKCHRNLLIFIVVNYGINFQQVQSTRYLPILRKKGFMFSRKISYQQQNNIWKVIICRLLKRFQMKFLFLCLFQFSFIQDFNKLSCHNCFSQTFCRKKKLFQRKTFFLNAEFLLKHFFKLWCNLEKLSPFFRLGLFAQTDVLSFTESSCLSFAASNFLHLRSKYTLGYHLQKLYFKISSIIL